MTVRLTPGKANKLRELRIKLLNTQHPTIREVARVIDHMISSAPAVVVFVCSSTRTLENEKIDALKQNFGNFEAKMELSPSFKLDHHFKLVG